MNGDKFASFFFLPLFYNHILTYNVTSLAGFGTVFSVIAMPSVGLELTALRWRVAGSTN